MVSRNDALVHGSIRTMLATSDAESDIELSNLSAVFGGRVANTQLQPADLSPNTIELQEDLSQTTNPNKVIDDISVQREQFDPTNDGPALLTTELSQLSTPRMGPALKPPQLRVNHNVASMVTMSSIVDKNRHGSETEKTFVSSEVPASFEQNFRPLNPTNVHIVAKDRARHLQRY